jgi:hypothetical protein
MNQLTHLIKHIQEQVQNAYMFRHRGAIVSELLRTQEQKTNS